MPADDSAARVPIGPVGRYVIRNLERLRSERGLTYRELSERLERIGRPIPTLGLSRIEKGNRRVDADDLVALCVALEVSPGGLLLPPDPGEDADDEIELTTELRAPGQAVRRWAAGHSPLPDLDGITWDRPAFVWRVREAELADLQRRLTALEATQRLEAARQARRARQPVVAAIVTSAEGVLITRRVDASPLWGFVTGAIEPGEDPAVACAREVKEETGLEVQAGRLLGERNPHPRTGRDMIYMAARPVGDTRVIVGDEAELAEVKWASLAETLELLPDIFGPVREYLESEL